MMVTRTAALEDMPTSMLTHYLRDIRKYSILSVEEELGLAELWIEKRDPWAAERMVTSHLGLIVKVAKGYRGYGLPLSELIAEGNVGMMQAVEKFQPARGVRLSTYAIFWIRAAILTYILNSFSIVRVCTTGEQKRLFFKLRRLKARLQALDDGDLPTDMVATIAVELAVRPADVVTMNRRLSSADQSLNAPVGPDDDGEWQDRLVDPSPDQETILAEKEEYDQRRALLSKAMTHLGERERYIFTARRLRERPKKLDDLAREYGVSRERIRQIEERAFNKLREALGLQPARRSRPSRPLFPHPIPLAATEDFHEFPAAYAVPRSAVHPLDAR